MGAFEQLLPRFDELYAVSDIHMGGERSGARNFQIFKYGQRLANLIAHVAAQQPGKQVALVLDGDIIDSLAEEGLEGYVQLQADRALGMIDRICGDASFAPVWAALADFVKTPGRTLVLVVGNHDIELALPPVESWLRRRLGGGNPEVNARIVFATHGEGFTCLVGPTRVFCTHGNEVDGWNRVDYTELGTLAHAMNAGHHADAAKWKPNAGTRMVVDLMNVVKRRFPFVDLLKPETKPVISALLVLDPALVKNVDLGDAYDVVRDKVRGDLEVQNLLSAGAPIDSVAPAALAAVAARELLGTQASQVVPTADRARSEEEDRLLLQAGKAVARGEVASAKAEASGEGTLGWSDIVKGWIGLTSREEGLRRALADWLKDDTTFAIGAGDEADRKIIERVGPDVDVVIAGHSHLARKIEFAPKRYYYNCGTWIRLLRLTKEALASEQVFTRNVYPALASGRMDDLDAATIPGKAGVRPLVFDRTTMVRVSATDGGTSELLRVSDGPGTGTITLMPEEQAPQ